MKINEQVIWELIKYIFSYIQYIFLSKKGKLESNLRLDEPPPPTALRLRKGFLVVRNSPEKSKQCF